jgi:hypothetical protein
MHPHAVFMPPELLVARIRGEYREMPGLSLTLAQACRLWHMHARECEAVLETLVAEGFLGRTQSGSFIALPATSQRLIAGVASGRGLKAR